MRLKITLAFLVIGSLY